MQAMQLHNFPRPPLEISTFASNDQLYMQSAIVPSPLVRQIPSNGEFAEASRFTLFPQLPLEIQRLIWHAAMPGPRLVFIGLRELKMTIGEWEKEHNTTWPFYEEGDDRGEDDEMASDATLFGVECKTPIPAVFLACKEAYNVAAGLYKRTFACVESVPQTYFNFNIDTLCLHLTDFQYNRSAWSHFRTEDAEDLGNVEKMAVQVNYEYGPSYENFNQREITSLLRIFQGVKLLTIIVQSRNVDPMYEQLDLELADVDVAAGEEALMVYHFFESNYVYQRSCGRYYSIEKDFPWVQLPFIDKEQFKEWEERDACWTIPEIEYKALVPHELKMKYEEAKKAYEAAVERFASIDPGNNDGREELSEVLS